MSKDEKPVVFHQSNQDHTETRRIIFTPSVCIENRREIEKQESEGKAESRSQNPEAGVNRLRTALTNSVFFSSGFCFSR
jgi:hypothetical protein